MVDKVARRLQLHPVTIRRWIKSGKIRGINLGSDRAGWRIRRFEIEQIIAGTHQPSPMPDEDADQKNPLD